jgi:TldD protein
MIYWYTSNLISVLQVKILPKGFILHYVSSCMDFVQTLIEESPAEYAEARFHRREKIHIILRKGELEDIKSEINEGVGMRVLHDGAWGFSSINTLDKADLRETLAIALKMARASSQGKNEYVHLQEVTPAAGEFRAYVKDPLPDHSLEEKIDVCLDTDKGVLSHKGMRSSFVYYEELIDSKWIFTSDGADVHIVDSKPQFFVGAVAGSGSDLVSYFDTYGTTGGWEIFKERPPESMVEKATSMAARLVDAPYPQGGKAAVVLDPGLVGLLSHEAVGHTMEADAVLSGAVTEGRIGEEVVSPLVTMVDSGHVKAAGWTPVDDEGVKCTDVTMIQDGVLTGFLHNRETAYILDAQPTGNARAWEYDYEPLIRMRNTYIEKGDWNLQEILEDTKKGYLLKGARAGQADSNAEFMFQVKEVYTLSKGEIGDLLRSATLTGNAFDVLKTVDAVSSDFWFDMGYGVCMKGQFASVDGGGPFVRCELLVGGVP